jgi:DNA-binding NarL/FixJ family response regulator
VTGAGTQQADNAFRASAWAAAADAFAAADRASPLPAGALERWGTAAYLCGRDEESDAARERAHHAYLADGDVDGAARVGHWLGVTLVVRGEGARGGGWFARVQTVLDDNGLTDSVWQAFLQVSDGMRLLFAGDAESARELFSALMAGAAGWEDPSLQVLIRNGLGQSLIAAGRIEEGLHRLDEVMVTVTSSPQITPEIVGLMYCAVIDACRRCFDHGRARQWTDALSRWCADQPELVPYRGQCLVHRAEVLQMHGMWRDAHDEVEQVFRRLGENPTDAAAAMAHYQRGELHRLRGEPDAAEAAYRKAARCGRDPEPGLALLRLAQGKVDAAYGAIRRAVDEARMASDRLRLLPAYVDIALAAGELEPAERAAAELRTAATARDAPILTASAAQADGQVALARGDAAAALTALRDALAEWQRLAAPYDAAMTRLHIASACRMLGDDETAELELDAARWAFDQLGATTALRVVDAATARDPTRPAPGGLTQRESQILRILATGATNRAIAQELFLSEKTVARHVANIFLKLEVTSRAAATAFAYENHLV